MAINKTCKQCAKEFIVEDADLEFYKKMSPNFDGKTFQYPAPTLCPDCRAQRRLSWRNERTVYKRKCDQTGEDIVSIYSPDSPYKVYKNSQWWSDEFDPFKFGRDFDFSKSFFKQYNQLLLDVPFFAINNPKTENCDYSNNCADCKNCYLSSVIFYESENTHYSYWVYHSKDNCDISFCDECEKSYDIALCNSCYECKYSTQLDDCRNCLFSFNLRGCSDCLFCTNLISKSYCIENKQLTKEQYEEELKKFNFTSREKISEYKGRYEQMKQGLIVKFANNVKCENVLGDYLRESKNAKYNFSSKQVEDCKYCLGHEYAKNIYDSLGGSYEWAIEVINTGFGTNFWHCLSVLDSSNMMYCQFCFNCRDCFGCVGLKRGQYCVFNKQYTKEEYERLVAKILEKMQETGEWGEYFPAEYSPFGYNETVANSYFPLTRDEANTQGFAWKDNTNLIEYQGEHYLPEDDINQYLDESKQKELLAGIIKCEVSGRPFRIMPQELVFYINNQIPIPTIHYDVRYTERFNRRNPAHLWHRTCMNEGCDVEFETTYAPDRPEKVYCESCYQKSVI